MSNYIKATDFSVKDGLTTGDPDKIVKGTEIDEEFDAIAVAVQTKADLFSPVFLGTPTAPTASQSVNNTQLATTAFAKAAAAAAFPIGGIIMWSGTIAAIPTGWALCNGSNGTPDLRDRFIIGANQDDGGAAKTNVTGSLTQTGGSKDAIVVSHTHTATVTDAGHFHVTDGTAGSNRHAVRIGSDAGIDATSQTASAEDAFYVNGSRTGTASTGISVSNSTTGSSGTNVNLPPYYALAFIMKTA